MFNVTALLLDDALLKCVGTEVVLQKPQRIYNHNNNKTTIYKAQ